MNTNETKSGFTLIELMMTAVAFSILALATGSMLVFGWQGWTRINASVDMQRDASLAMRVMAREVRKSSVANITVGSSLGCVDPSGSNVTFTVSNGNLEMAVGGTFFMNLVRGQAVSLSSSITNSTGVAITLNLLAGDDVGSIDSVVYVRN